MLLALPANIKLDWRDLTRTNDLADCLQGQ
jgi:hypothetical protein